MRKIVTGYAKYLRNDDIPVSNWMHFRLVGADILHVIFLSRQIDDASQRPLATSDD